jgi:hypothetical protein
MVANTLVAKGGGPLKVIAFSYFVSKPGSREKIRFGPSEGFAGLEHFAGSKTHMETINYGCPHNPQGRIARS